MEEHPAAGITLESADRRADELLWLRYRVNGS